MASLDFDPVQSPPAANAAEYRELVTRDGFRFQVRPTTSDDEPGLAGLLSNVSQEDLRFRFLTAVNTVSHQSLVRMTTVDHQRTEDFLAFDGDRMIATAMLAADARLERAEVAISIHSEYRNRGVGWSLLDYVARYAEAKGIKTLESIESRDNHDAIVLEQEMGFTVKSYPDDAALVLVEKQLKSTSSPESPGRNA